MELPSPRLMSAYFDSRSCRSIYKSAEHSKEGKHIKEKRRAN
jgi:hypothetical protein